MIENMVLASETPVWKITQGGRSEVTGGKTGESVLDKCQMSLKSAGQKRVFPQGILISKV